jgi:hypothetical protein
MKLNINKMYILYTTSNYIENKQVKILGYINYDRASQYQSLVENIAINEKFIESTGNTMEYLKNQLYYDCIVVTNNNGEWLPTDEHIVVWDDIIDSERTQRLNENYTYKLSINFKNLSDNDNITKADIINTIKNAVNSKYNGSIEKIGLDIVEIYDNSLDSVSSKLTETENLLEKTKESLIAINSLQTTSKQIVDDFNTYDVNTKVNNLTTKLDSIESSVNRIISQLK